MKKRTLHYAGETPFAADFGDGRFKVAPDTTFEIEEPAASLLLEQPGFTVVGRESRQPADAPDPKEASAS